MQAPGYIKKIWRTAHKELISLRLIQRRSVLEWIHFTQWTGLYPREKVINSWNNRSQRYMILFLKWRQSGYCLSGYYSGVTSLVLMSPRTHVCKRAPANRKKHFLPLYERIVSPSNWTAFYVSILPINYLCPNLALQRTTKTTSEEDYS